MPMSDVNFDKYFSCLSWQIFNKNRGRLSEHNYHIVKEEKGE